jgi:hypothetical protein
MNLLSVKTCECRIDVDGLPQRSREAPLGLRPLEADEAAAGIRTATGRRPVLDEHSILRREAQELALGRAPAAADAAPDRIRH